MAYPAALDRLVEQVAAQVRWRRAEHYALRGTFYGALAALGPLVARNLLGPLALPVAGALVVLAAIVGLVWGLVRRVPAADAARLADRAFGLEDRLTTALEWAARPDRTPLVDALVADAAARVEAVRARQIVPRVLPREVRLLPLPAVAAFVLVVAPALPLPSRLPDFSRVAEQDETQERAGTPMTDEGARTLPRDPVRYPMLQERDVVPRGGGTGAATAGDQAAVFKDTSLASQRPDFNSFLKKADDRLKLLDRSDRLPDLASDFTTSQYRMMFKKSKSLTSGLRPDQVSPKKLRELLEEMQKLGRKDGNNWGSDASEGMEALDSGQQDKALEAMEKALGKMREAEEQQRGSKGLKGGRESGGAAGQRGGKKGGQGAEGKDEGDNGEGLLPGKGKSGAPKGDATDRLRANPYDASIQGESRRGRKDAYDTNMTGRGGQAASRLPNLGVVGQYRKMMEDAIAREQIPRDYHAQIRDYFQALDER